MNVIIKEISRTFVPNVDLYTLPDDTYFYSYSGMYTGYVTTENGEKVCYCGQAYVANPNGVPLEDLTTHYAARVILHPNDGPKRNIDIIHTKREVSLDEENVSSLDQYLSELEKIMARDTRSQSDEFAQGLRLVDAIREELGIEDLGLKQEDGPYWEVELRDRKDGRTLEVIFSGTEQARADDVLTRWYNEHPEVDSEINHEQLVDGSEGVFADICYTYEPLGLGKCKAYYEKGVMDWSHYEKAYHVYMAQCYHDAINELFGKNSSEFRSNFKDELANEIFENTANPEQVVGYYLVYYGEEAYKQWSENTSGKKLSEQDKEIDAILSSLCQKEYGYEER